MSIIIDAFYKIMTWTKRLSSAWASSFALSHWCSASGHDWVPISTCDATGAWVPTGVERCENCGRERPSICHYCDEGIAADTCVYGGNRCCRGCFDERDSVISAFGYQHGDPRWTGERK